MNSNLPGRLRRVPTIYLAGGMRSNWQDEVISQVKGIIVLDPRNHGSKDEDAYTAWDLAAVEKADLIFGFIEASNPCGAGLAVEMGMAYALGKSIIYIEESGFTHQRYFGMVRAIARAQQCDVASSLQEGIEQLQAYVSSFGRKLGN